VTPKKGHNTTGLGCRSKCGGFNSSYGPSSGAGFGFGEDLFSDLGEILRNFGFGNFGFEGTREATYQGEDIEVILTVTFRDAVLGAEKEITLNKTETCPVCKGSGAEPGSGTVTCPTCNGKELLQSIEERHLVNLSFRQPAIRAMAQEK